MRNTLCVCGERQRYAECYQILFCGTGVGVTQAEESSPLHSLHYRFVLHMYTVPACSYSQAEKVEGDARLDVFAIGNVAQASKGDKQHSDQHHSTDKHPFAVVRILHLVLQGKDLRRNRLSLTYQLTATQVS